MLATHCTPDGEKPRLDRIVGLATLTTAISSMTMSWPSTATAAIHDPAGRGPNGRSGVNGPVAHRPPAAPLFVASTTTGWPGGGTRLRRVHSATRPGRPPGRARPVLPECRRAG